MAPYLPALPPLPALPILMCDTITCPLAPSDILCLFSVSLDFYSILGRFNYGLPAIL